MEWWWMIAFIPLALSLDRFIDRCLDLGAGGQQFDYSHS
jgi:hypothetical protein